MWPPAATTTASSLTSSSKLQKIRIVSCSRSWRTVCKFDNKVWCEYHPRPSLFNMLSSTRSLMIAPRSSAGFKSGDEPGHSLALVLPEPWNMATCHAGSKLLIGHLLLYKLYYYCTCIIVFRAAVRALLSALLSCSLILSTCFMCILFWTNKMMMMMMI